MNRRMLLPVFVLMALVSAPFASLAGAAGEAKTIRGTPKADVLRGTKKADTIDGRAGDDKIHGMAGNDRLIGGAGNDLLVGGSGSDTLSCGAGKDTAQADKLDTVSSTCETVKGLPAPQPPVSPPPAPAPLSGPGAPATYAFGSELNVAQQALVRRGLDAGARYYRAALGRELPTFTVWAHTDLEAMIRTYAETKPTSLDDARRLWEDGQVGHATPRKVWLGPAWFQTASTSQERALKIAAHEAFHLFQYEIVGQRPLSVSGLDEIPSAGPWWLAEGSAEYFAYLAVAADGVGRFADVRAGWMRSAKATSATLVALATLRGQRETQNAYDIYALATELLLQSRDPKLVFAYYEAIARGVPWSEAFAETFGRTHDAFVGEFEALRRASAA